MKKLLAKLKYNQRGFSHHLLIPIIVVVVIAGVGVYLLTNSRADPLSDASSTGLTSSSAAATPSGCSNLGTVQVSVLDHGHGWVTVVQKYHQTLSQGSSGNCVKAAQGLLSRFCTPSTTPAVDGQFGAKTARAVRAVQSAANTGISSHKSPIVLSFKVNGQPISVDGAIGPQVWGIMHEVLDNNYNTVACS